MLISRLKKFRKNRAEGKPLDTNGHASPVLETKGSRALPVPDPPQLIMLLGEGDTITGSLSKQL